MKYFSEILLKKKTTKIYFMPSEVVGLVAEGNMPFFVENCYRI